MENLKSEQTTLVEYERPYVAAADRTAQRTQDRVADWIGVLSRIWAMSWRLKELAPTDEDIPRRDAP